MLYCFDFDAHSVTLPMNLFIQKKDVFLRFSKLTWYKYITTVKLKIKKKKLNEEVQNDHGEFQQQSTQRFVNKYKHTSSRNDRWQMRLKLI